MAKIISADEIKKQLPNYLPERAGEVHRESAKIADTEFEIALREEKYKNVILLNGGTASGKTEFISTQLIDEDSIIFDATQSTELGAKTKISKILKAGKTPIIYSVIPDDLKRAFIAFLNRDRKFRDVYFYQTHSGSRKTIQWIAKNYPDITIVIIESSYTPSQSLQFAKLPFENRSKLIDYLDGIQMSEDDIISEVVFE